MAEFEHRLHGWPQARRFVVARRFLPQEEPQTTLFILGRYVYRAWVTNMHLTPAGVWHFYDGRAGMEPRICELREDYALRKIPTKSFAANALYLEIIRLCLQPGHSVSTELLGRIVAEPDTPKTTLQTVPNTR
jgi:hypothetical protein